jgi:hypothetical protein
MADHISEAYRVMSASKKEDEKAIAEEMVKVLFEERRKQNMDLAQLQEYSDSMFRKMIYGKNNDPRTRRIVSLVMKRLSELLGV